MTKITACYEFFYPSVNNPKELNCGGHIYKAESINLLEFIDITEYTFGLDFEGNPYDAYSDFLFRTAYEFWKVSRLRQIEKDHWELTECIAGIPKQHLEGVKK